MCLWKRLSLEVSALASSSHTTKSAFLPTSMDPLSSRPATAAGEELHHPAMSSTVAPRSLPAVQVAGRPYWSPAIPPHALKKSPSSRYLSPGGLGEWSDPTVLIVPLSSCFHRPSLFSAVLTGGAHLYCVAPSGTPPDSKKR